MDFELTEQQRMIRQAVHDTVKEFGLDYWREKDRAGEYFTEVWDALGRGGWVGTAIPEEYGGAGQGIFELAIVAEEACRGGGGLTLGQPIVFTPVCGGEIVSRHGNEEQKRKYLPKIAAGELNFCIALTEPNAGTNTLAIETRAVREGDFYRINGQKMFISGVQQAQKALIVARTTPLAEAPRKSFGLSLFVADVQSEGFSYEPIEKVGTHCVPSNMVFFDDLRVPAGDLVGEENEGWRILLDVLNSERVIGAISCIATGDLAIRLACDYARERQVFGRPIGMNQGIQFPLADLKIQLEAARLLAYKAACEYDRGNNAGPEANMAVYLGSRVAFQACDQAMQTFGGLGFTAEAHVERLWRDVRLIRIGPISQEMVLNYVSQHVLGLPRSY